MLTGVGPPLPLVAELGALELLQADTHAATNTANRYFVNPTRQIEPAKLFLFIKIKLFI